MNSVGFWDCIKKEKAVHIFLFLLIVSCKNSGTNQPSTDPITPQAVYTVDDPGNWEGKQDSHSPAVEILSAGGRDNVRVTVTLADASQTHYIEKIFIADSKGKPWQEKIFKNNPGDPTPEPAESKIIPGGITSAGSGKQWSATFTIPVTSANAAEYSVYARCSQHDLWMARLASSNPR